jgi:predicted transcriptional regulator
MLLHGKNLGGQMDEKDELMKWIDDSGAVTLTQLRDRYELGSDEARHILISLLEEDLIIWCPALPRQAVFFTRKPEVGTRAFGLLLTRQAKNGTVREARDELIAKVRSLFDEHPETGMLIKQVMDALNISRPRAAKALDQLVKDDVLSKRQAKATGTFGRPPFIYGFDSRAIRIRELRYLRDRKGLNVPDEDPTPITPKKPLKPKAVEDDDDWRRVVKFL